MNPRAWEVIGIDDKRVRARTLQSGAIVWCEYDFDQQILSVHFNGGPWEYRRVPRTVWGELLRSTEGPGAAVNRLLAGRYDYRRIGDFAWRRPAARKEGSA